MLQPRTTARIAINRLRPHARAVALKGLCETPEPIVHPLNEHRPNAHHYALPESWRLQRALNFGCEVEWIDLVPGTCGPVRECRWSPVATGNSPANRSMAGTTTGRPSAQPQREKSGTYFCCAG
jgi:hypothetical protein